MICIYIYIHIYVYIYIYIYLNVHLESMMIYRLTTTNRFIPIVIVSIFGYSRSSMINSNLISSWCGNSRGVRNVETKLNQFCQTNTNLHVQSKRVKKTFQYSCIVRKLGIYNDIKNDFPIQHQPHVYKKKSYVCIYIYIYIHHCPISMSYEY